MNKEFKHAQRGKDVLTARGLVEREIVRWSPVGGNWIEFYNEETGTSKTFSEQQLNTLGEMISFAEEK